MMLTVSKITNKKLLKMGRAIKRAEYSDLDQLICEFVWDFGAFDGNNFRFDCT